MRVAKIRSGIAQPEPEGDRRVADRGGECPPGGQQRAAWPGDQEANQDQMRPDAMSPAAIAAGRAGPAELAAPRRRTPAGLRGIPACPGRPISS